MQSYQPTSSRQSEIPDNLLRNDVQSYEPTSSRQTEIPERFPNDDVQDLCELSNQTSVPVTIQPQSGAAIAQVHQLS